MSASTRSKPSTPTSTMDSTSGAAGPLDPKAMREECAPIEWHVRGFHGIHCPKVQHMGDGYLHSHDDDGPYDVDGITYCGRCHGWLQL